MKSQVAVGESPWLEDDSAEFAPTTTSAPYDETYLPGSEAAESKLLDEVDRFPSWNEAKEESSSVDGLEMEARSDVYGLLQSDPALLEIDIEGQAATPAVAPACYRLTDSGAVPSIGFEFDLSYGASKVTPPLEARRDPGWGASVFTLEGENVTSHRIRRDGFRLEGDGNRIEIATRKFPLTDSGRREMKRVMKEVLALASDLRRRCRAASPDTGLGYAGSVGAPRHFTPPYIQSPATCFFPLSFSSKPPYYRRSCGVAASPQATFSLPLAKIDSLVTAIRRSERKIVAGRALSAPKGDRQGDRSVALYAAQWAVNRNRRAHIKRRTRLSDGSRVTAQNYTPTLQGLLILLVSYLRAGELRYGANDWEVFAKAYLPLNVKNPFRLLYDDLTVAEKRVFRELYDSPRTNLWRLAKRGATTSDRTNKLFPPKTWGHQGGWFDPVPTWDDLIEKTIRNTPLIRTETGPKKKGEDVGCEVSFAPLSRILPYRPGSRVVTVEMRRLGFNWVFSHGYRSKRTGRRHPGWSSMTTMLFDLAVSLNK